jgi:hypothetical protein
MAKCAKCKQRKAKRYCPALGEDLCTLCCGMLREKEIHCPSSCTFLVKHKSYQEKRILEKRETSVPRNRAAEEDILRDERMAWLAFHIEAPLKAYGEQKESFTDKEAIMALEYAKEKIEKGERLIHLPGEEIKPKNEVGEAICQSMEKCRYEKSIILPREMQSYTKEEKLKCIERIILSVKFLARGNFEGRNYIQELQARFAKIKELSYKKKVITPT